MHKHASMILRVNWYRYRNSLTFSRKDWKTETANDKFYIPWLLVSLISRTPSLNGWLWGGSHCQPASDWPDLVSDLGRSIFATRWIIFTAVEGTEPTAGWGGTTTWLGPQGVAMAMAGRRQLPVGEGAPVEEHVMVMRLLVVAWFNDFTCRVCSYWWMQTWCERNILPRTCFPCRKLSIQVSAHFLVNALLTYLLSPEESAVHSANG